MSHHRVKCGLSLFCFLLHLAVVLPSVTFSAIAFGQAGGASISGLVSDPSGAVVHDAQVSIKNVATNVVAVTVTNQAGIYTFPSLPPGDYVLTVHKQGFRSVDLVGLTLYTQDRLERNFTLNVGSASESVTVAAEVTNISPAVSMTVDREFVENMPLNGRSFQDLIQLAPGTASTESGYYSVNGQRADGNNFTVDGVSSNLGGSQNQIFSIGNGISGSAPSQTVLGTTQSLASIDSLQEFTIQTSGYTAEYGRSPGGQVQFTTRSGTNDLHGSLFDYFRNTDLDANSYLNNYNDKPRTAEHQNDFGGTIGGPLVVPHLYNGRDNTFYFFSYEGLRLLLPSSETEFVPTQVFRNAASPNVLPFLNAAPLPNTAIAGDTCTVSGTTVNLSGAAGPEATPCDEEFYHGYSYPEHLNNMSIRVDENLNSGLHVFMRYADTNSSEESGAEEVSNSAINSHSWTAGLTENLTGSLLNDVRFNYNRDGEEATATLRSIGGSTPFARDLVIPAIYDNQYASSFPYVSIPGTSLTVSADLSGAGSVLEQYQLVEALAWTRRTHTFRFGSDWRRLSSLYANATYLSYPYIQTSAAIQQGYATSLQISAANPGQPVFYNASLYAQDHWKVTPRVGVDYGVRWEFNPPPGPSNGHYPATLTSSDLSVANLAPAATPPYQTTYNHFAPRVGFAWNVVPSEKYALTLRGGFGIFFDTGQQSIGNGYTVTYPFQATGPTQTNVALPLSSSVLAPPSLDFPLVPPYPYLTGISSPNLTLPYTEQWNISIDQELNGRNTASISYVGNNGRKLLFEEYHPSVPGNPVFNQIQLTSNASQSSYNALQVQDAGRIVNGLDIVGSFTWAHSLDNASSDYSSYVPVYGNSNYDLRRVLNVALNYQAPPVNLTKWTESVTHGWLLANRFSAQSGYPITSFSQATVVLPTGVRQLYEPNLVPGVPIYLHGSAADYNGERVPGSWRLNPAAFSCVPTNRSTPCVGTPDYNGDLGRNYVRNPPFWTLNTSVQRNFPVYEHLSLKFNAEAFNILNHPNPSGPYVGSLTSADFGRILGTEATIGSSNALYSMGSARSLELSLRLQF